MEIICKYNIGEQVFVVCDGYEIQKKEISSIEIKPKTAGGYIVEYFLTPIRRHEEEIYATFEEAKEYAKVLAEQTYRNNIKKIEKQKE